MNYVIDGYNLFFRIEEEVNPLGVKREDFIVVLNDALSRMHFHATLIFDSGKTHTTPFPSNRPLSALEIVFSPEHVSADEYILERLAAEKNAQLQVIITSDRDLARKAKDLGAKTKTVEAFFALLAKKAPKESSEKKQEVESSREFKRLLDAFESKLNEE